MAHTSYSKPLSFAFSYGFTEGKAHSLSLTRKLLKAGYVLADSPKQADIVIAHSAGCWFELDGLNPKILLYIGMPLPTKRARQTWYQANKVAVKSQFKNRQLKRLAKSTVLSLLYLLRHPRRNLQIIKQAEHAEPIIYKKALTVFVMNQHDPWPKSQRLNQFIQSEAWCFISLKGTHNNIWHEPEKYVKLIDHYAKILAKTK